MLKVVAEVNNRRTLFVGLSRENTVRMHRGQPIAVDVQALLAQVKEVGDVQDIIIFAGESDRDVHATLAEYLPLPPFSEPDNTDTRPDSEEK